MYDCDTNVNKYTKKLLKIDSPKFLRKRLSKIKMKPKMFLYNNPLLFNMLRPCLSP